MDKLNKMPILIASSKKNTAPKKKIGAVKKLSTVILVAMVVVIGSQIINAAKYSATVNVKDGENIMGINPLNDKLDFGDLSRGNGMTRYINLKSGGNVPTYVAVLQFGEISDLIKLDRNYFILSPNEEVKLAFEINIPPSAQSKKYSGQVWVFRLPKIL